MHLFYTLITSGLLILTEIPVEQPPPTVVYQDVSYALSHSASDYGGSQESVTYSSYSSFDQNGEWYLTSSPVTYLGISNNSFPVQANPEPFEARQPPQYEGVRLQDGPELIPGETKVSPTPMPKTTAPTSVAVANSTTANSALATYRQQSALPVSGFAMFYNPHVMQEVLSNRLAMGQVSLCGECVGTVALLRAGDLNRRVWLQWADGIVEGPFLVADVAATHHVAQLLARNWVVDVDNSTAVRRKMAGPVWVTVWSAPPTGGEGDLPPFAPLYSSLPEAVPSAAQATVPVATATPADTPLPALSATPYTSLSVAVVTGFPADTPVPTITPLPALNATPTASVVVSQGSVATQTPTLINTPSPTMSPTFTPTQLPSFTVIPTTSIIPTVSVISTTVVATAVGGFPTETPIPTNTALPALNITSTAAVVTASGGFPTETPVPTNTALPALSPTSTQPATTTPTITATQISLPTATPTMIPTAALVASPTVDSVVTQGGFPPDTPVPTITPLPAINSLPTPTVTPSPN